MTRLAYTPSSEHLFDAAFWQERFPNLSIGADLSRLVVSDPPLASSVERAHQRLHVEGYFQDSDATLSALAPELATAVRRCIELKIPPAFVFAFDQPWAAFLALHGMLQTILGPGYRMLPDFWAWHVDPQAGEAGWPPHRDKGKLSLAADGSPLSLSVWVPLTVATPQNGCMYLVPKDKDPRYNTDREYEFDTDFTSMRALPASPGEYLCWDQAILHWGSRSSRFASGPRISLAFEFQRGDVAPFNQPLLQPGYPLTLRQRLKLVSKQILQYEHMYPLEPALKQTALHLFRA